MKKLICLFVMLGVLLGTAGFAASAADDFDKVLATFPDSYKASLSQLHAEHPNWKFERVSVGKNFATCLNAEHNCKTHLNLVEVSSAKDARACQSDCPNAAYHTLVDGVYRCASYDYIAECMDPTNFLRESLIFQFEDLGAKAYYTQEKLETALAATSSFMANKTYRTTSKTYYYSQIILEACRENEIDALFIISRITNEVGSASPAKLAKGYDYEYEKGKTKTVYNFFNIGGNVSASAKYAYNKKWFDPKAALEGGIKFIAQNYVKSGQYTNYFQKFQVNPDCVYGFYEHQYMQGTDAVINEAGYTFKNYSKLNILDKEHVFRIPVYENLSKVNYEAQDLSFQGASQSEKYGYVNSQVSSTLKVRKQPSTSAEIRCSINRSVLLKITGKTGAWYQVEVLNGASKGNKGYCHGDYVNLAQRLTVPKTNTIKLKPKLRTSTCSYAAAYQSVSGAVTIKDGVASGKKIGTTVFKATSGAGNTGYLELECTGLVDAPVFTVTGGEKQVTLAWKAVSDAKCYRVYRYNPDTKGYTRLTDTTALSYTQTGLAQGTVYSYLVRAMDINGYGSAYTSASIVSAVTLPAKPAFKLSATSDTITLSWSKVKGAAEYGIWVYTAKTDSYKRVGTTTAASFKYTGLSANKKYTLLVRSLNDSGRSAFSRNDNRTIQTAPVAPKVTATGGAKQISLSWNKCSGAAYYRVYRYNSSTKAYTKAAQTTATAYTAKNLADGTQYIWLVRAFNADGSGSAYTAANHLTTVTKPTKPAVSVTAGSTHVTLTWKAVKGASAYGIWSYNTATKQYTKLGSTAATSFTVEKLTPDKSYVYLVRSHNASGWSAFTVKDNINTKAAPAKPLLKLEKSESGVQLSWDACAGAVSYRVYAFNSKSGKFTRLASVKTTSYTVSAEIAADGFLVRAFNANGSGSDYTSEDVKF